MKCAQLEQNTKPTSEAILIITLKEAELLFNIVEDYYNKNKRKANVKKLYNDLSNNLLIG